MKYKLAVFDFDGTLADSFPFFLDTVNELAETHQFKKVDLTEIETLRGYDARQMMNRLGLPFWKLPIVAGSFRTKMADRIDRIPLFPGVENMLRVLSGSGIVLSLVTSNSRDNARRILKPMNMDLMVHHQCGASLFGKRSGLKNILRKTGIRPGEAIYIGDEIRDLEAAHAEGVHFGAVSWGYTRPDAFPKHSPAEMFSNVGEIVGKIVG